MDDVADKRARTILCEDMYTSDMTRAQREAVSPYYSVKAPLPGLTTKSNPVSYSASRVEKTKINNKYILNSFKTK